MDLQSVRALKAEVAERIVRPTMAETRLLRHYGATARSLRRTTGVEAGIALGIARGHGSGDFRLAVRIQHRALETAPGLIDRIETSCRREVDLRYIGRVGKDMGREAIPVPWHRVRQRPLLIGVSVGHTRVTAGTLGAFVLHRQTRRPGLLSNNHVLANENAARLGDLIIQPGRYDGGRRGRDSVGTLLDFVPLEAGAGNLLDAAIALLDPEIAFDPATLTGVGELRGIRLDVPEPGTLVAKVGRTTGATRGIVTAIEVDDVVVGYEAGELSFDRQIEIESVDGLPFSDGGDSGSVIVDESGMACALLFAGSDQGGSNGKGLTYANHLPLALERLNVELATEWVGS